jgi:nitroreductase
MDFSELLIQRRSVRDYLDKPVPTDLIQEIIKDSIKAPNAGNMQLWRFVIVNNRQWMNKISAACKHAILEDITQNPNSGYKVYETTVKNPDYNVFYNAPALVYIVGSAKARTLPIDAGLLAAYFMMAATVRGLGTCFIAQGGEVKDPQVLAELGIPENNRIYAPIIVGYPKTVPPMPERKDPKILKIIQ